MERRANRDISLSKFIDFLLSKSYSPVSVYRIGDKVVFIEVRTPKVQRSFVIHVDSLVVTVMSFSIICHLFECMRILRVPG